MSHYELLGVAPTATFEETRRAYLAAARRSHPDVAGAESAERMQELNNAWATLRDEARRRRYDESLGLDESPIAQQRPVKRPFVPFHPEDEDDDDTWRYADDTTDPETAPGMLVQLVPLALAAAAVALGVLGVLLRTKALWGLAVVVGVLAVIALLLAPMVAMALAARVENERRTGDKPTRR